MKKIIHLCADIGSDSEPYRKAGYNVVRVGKDIDVRNYIPPQDVYGIIANPPCTEFSFARTNAKLRRNLWDGLALVRACLNIIWVCQTRINSDVQKTAPLKFWVLENPNGMLKWFLGHPAYQYSPHEFGDTYQKKTNLWGFFNRPEKPLILLPKLPKFDKLLSHEIHPEFFGKLSRTERRSICSAKFAQAFFEANR